MESNNIIFLCFWIIIMSSYFYSVEASFSNVYTNIRIDKLPQQTLSHKPLQFTSFRNPLSVNNFESHQARDFLTKSSKSNLFPHYLILAACAYIFASILGFNTVKRQLFSYIALKSILTIFLYLLLFQAYASPNEYSGFLFGDANKHERGTAIGAMPDGGFVISGYSMTSGTSNYRFIVVRVNSNLEKIWEYEQGCENTDPATTPDIWIRVLMPENDGIIFAGTGVKSCGQNAQSIGYMWKMDYNWASHVYEKWFNTPDYIYDVQDIKKLQDGGYLVLGYSTFNGQTNGQVLRLNRELDKVWYMEYPGKITITHELALCPNDQAVAVGDLHETASIYHSAIIKFSTIDGTLLNEAVTKHTYSTVFFSVDRTSSGYFCAVGTVYVESVSQNFFLYAKYNDDLTLGVRYLDTSYSQSVFAKVRELSNGNLLTAGYILMGGVWQSWANFGDIDLTSTSHWVKDAGIGGDNGLEDFVLVGYDGTAVFIGWEYSGTKEDLFLVKREGCGIAKYFSPTNDETCVCRPGSVVISADCVLPNDNTMTCKDINECADTDTMKAGCNVKCICKENYKWHPSAKTCLALNNKQVECGADSSKCYFSSVSGGCINTKCDCATNYKWKEPDKICAGMNNQFADCKLTVDCSDTRIDIGVCASGKCTCTANYKWKHDKCYGFNNKLGACYTVADCYDPTNKADCFDNKCICQAGHGWVLTELRCKGYNDGIGTCSDVGLDCFDGNIGRAECTNGKCICKQDYIWIEAKGFCVGHNNDAAYCTVPADCVISISNGACVSNKCTCVNHSSYDYAALQCLKNNDDFRTCATINECFDRSFRAKCLGNCKCNDEYIWRIDRLICAGKNNGKATCNDLQDCYDNNSLTGQCKSGLCQCQDGHVWSESDKKCFCAPGYYSKNNIGAGDCLECPTGQYQPAIAQPSCNPCGPYTYLPTTKGTSISECIPCPSNSFSSSAAKICTCDSGFYYDSNIGPGVGKSYCQPCHAFCDGCVDDSKKCSKCALLPGIYDAGPNQCLCDTNNGYYVLETGGSKDQCLKCHLLCKTCHGPSNSDCDSCKADISDLLPYDNHICKCKETWFFDINDSSKHCKPCAKFCAECIDSEAKCTTCVDNPGVVHKGSCKCETPGYFEYYNITSPNYHKEECVTCHPLCKLCDGPNSNQCRECRSKETGAIQIGANTCACKNHYYYDAEQGKCMECNIFCKNCFGSGNDKCDGCTSILGYIVIDNPHLCVFDCNQIPGYYRDQRECRLCHEDCINCIGPYAYQCTKCNGTSNVLYNNECKNVCPMHFVEIERICYECHSTCGECFNPSNEGCLSCKYDLMLYENKCFTNCPNGTYKLNTTHCAQCEYPCDQCIDKTKCLTCSKQMYYLRSQNKCVTAFECKKNNLYGDDKTGFCESCHFSCLTCRSPAASDCILCNFEKGFSRSNSDGSGDCVLTVCAEGSFLNIDYELSIAKCELCHESCETCLECGPLSCTSCKPGLVSISTENLNRFSCKACVEINKGYIMGTDSKCHEICGDGMNLGEVECDDGNKLPGDGCNEQCNVEDGFKCTHEHNGKDFCKDIISPIAELIVIKPNVLEIEFSELVIIDVNSTVLLNKYMEITIQGLKENCEIILEPISEFAINTTLSKFSLRVIATCTLKGKTEIYILKFKNPSLIHDPAGNILVTPSLHARTLRSIYISKGQQAAIESAGSAFSFTSLISLGLVLGMSLLQSTVVGGFWAFVNMVQILSYIPILKLDIPYNLSVFLTQYLSVAKVSIPFKILPDYIPNPAKFLSAFITDSLGENFNICGYETFSFIYNFGQEIVTWFCILGFYLVLTILDSILPETRCKFIRNWKKDYEYNGVIRILIETYISLSFCSFLNIWVAYPTNLARKISLAGAIIAGFLSVGFLVKSFFLVETQNLIKDNSFKEIYGNIIEDLKIEDENLICRYYYPFYMIRRLFYAVILIVFIDFPYIQLILILSTNSFPMLLYLVIYMPFEKTLTNVLNIFNEAIIFTSYLIILMINLGEAETNAQMNIGWLLISLVLLSLTASWVTMLPGAMKEFYSGFLEMFYEQPQIETTKIENLNAQGSKVILKADSLQKAHEISNDNINETQKDRPMKEEVKKIAKKAKRAKNIKPPV